MNKCIMCVDDETNLLKLYEQELTDAGYRVISSDSAQTALERLDAQPVDLVVLDIKLEDGDGLDVLVEIRKRDTELPVILHSAYSTYKGNFQSWMADHYLVKSPDLTELKNKIRELLGENG